MDLKKIIVYEKKSSIFEQLPEYLKVFGYKVIIINDACFESFQSKFIGIYELVIVNISVQNSKAVIDLVLSKNSKQKIVITSNNLNCVEVKSCDNCFKKYNLIRVLEPIELLDIIHISHTVYECEKFIDNPFLMKLHKVEKEINYLYQNYIFDKAKLLFVSSKQSSGVDHFTVNLVEKLEFYDIKYEVNVSGNVQVLRN